MEFDLDIWRAGVMCQGLRPKFEITRTNKICCVNCWVRQWWRRKSKKQLWI